MHHGAGFGWKAGIRPIRRNVAGAPILLKKSVNVAAAVSLRGIKLFAWRLLSRYRWSLMVFKSGSAPFVLRNRLRYAIWRRQAD